jgi:DNA-directed RNA polymerase subunit RPC12/RpoP
MNYETDYWGPLEDLMYYCAICGAPISIDDRECLTCGGENQRYYYGFYAETKSDLADG